MTILLSDLEANGLCPTKIHCICTKEKDTGVKHSFTKTKDYLEYVEDTKPEKHVFHNGLGYDVWHINRLIKPNLIDPKDVIDTMVVSKLVDYKRFNTHSLAEIGKALGVHKGDYTGGWETFNSDMLEYCEQDVEVLDAFLDKLWPYITDPAWASAMRTEHDMATLCYEMSQTGFLFDTDQANDILEEITRDKKELEDNFKVTFPDKLVEVNRVKLRYTKDKKLYSNITKAIAKYPKVEIEGEEVVIYDYKEFNPGSPKDRLDVLWDAGWSPFDKTDGHKKHLRSKMKWINH